MTKKNTSHERLGDSQHQVYGLHAVKGLLNEAAQTIKNIYCLTDRDDKRQQELLALAQQYGVSVEVTSRSKLDQLCRQNHQGVIAITRPFMGRSETELDEFLASLNAPRLLIIDRIFDPHNLGACLRTAECTGVDAVILPKKHSCPVNGTVRKVASGAVERLTIFTVTNLARVLDQLKQQGIWLYGTSDEGDKLLFDCDFSIPCAIVMGEEGKGIRPLTKEKCDFLVQIPMQGKVSSLNLSVATGMMLYETLRQRSK